MLKLLRVLAISIALAVVLASCGEQVPQEKPSATVSKELPLRGIVVSVQRDTNEAVIEHEEIEGFMHAMRMGFSVPEAEDLQKLQPGLPIKATLVVANGTMWVKSVEAAGPVGPVPGSTPEPGSEHHP